MKFQKKSCVLQRKIMTVKVSSKISDIFPLISETDNVKRHFSEFQNQ